VYPKVITQLGIPLSIMPLYDMASLGLEGGLPSTVMAIPPSSLTS
jgi:hypothetical protein